MEGGIALWRAAAPAAPPLARARAEVTDTSFLFHLAQYHTRLCEYLNTYERAFIVHADNVGSKQFSDIRAVRLRLGLLVGC